MIYLDNAATTKMLPEVFKSMKRYMEDPGNPSSAHSAGIIAKAAVEKAREQVAELLNAYPDEIFFTSGATEGNNLAISCLSCCPVLYTSQAEHKSVLNAVRNYCEPRRTCELAVTENGIPQTILQDLSGAVSFMLRNNELGTWTSVDAIKKFWPAVQYVHTDATQAIGHGVVDVKQLNVDMLTLSGHKIGGPMGTGAIYISRSFQSLVQPIIFGGGQERGVRSGTENVPGIVGLGAAAEWNRKHIDENIERDDAFRSVFLYELDWGMHADYRVNPSSGNIISITVYGVNAETLVKMMSVAGACISSGSACNTGKTSHVLRAIGMPDEEIDSTIRISSGWNTTEKDAVEAARILIKCVDNWFGLWEVDKVR